MSITSELCIDLKLLMECYTTSEGHLCISYQKTDQVVFNRTLFLLRRVLREMDSNFKVTEIKISDDEEDETVSNYFVRTNVPESVVEQMKGTWSQYVTEVFGIRPLASIVT